MGSLNCNCTKKELVNEEVNMVIVSCLILFKLISLRKTILLQETKSFMLRKINLRLMTKATSRLNQTPNRSMMKSTKHCRSFVFKCLPII